MTAREDKLTYSNRMLESPQDTSVVRWGNEGDSFVVLEVGYAKAPMRYDFPDSHNRTRSLRNTFYQSISSTATSQVSCDSSINTTSTKSDTPMKMVGRHRMVQVYVD